MMIQWSSFAQMKERKEDNSYDATGVDSDVASFLSWSKSICNPESSSMRIRGPSRLMTPFEVNTLNRQRQGD